MSKCRELVGGPNGAWRRKAQRRVLSKVKFPKAEHGGAESVVKGRRERTPNRSPESMSGAPEGRHSKRSEFSEGCPANRAEPGPGRMSGRGGAFKADPPPGARGA